MILGAKWIITRDGKTVLEDQAVRIDEFGKIAQIGQFDELKKHGLMMRRRIMEKLRSFRECVICIVTWDTGTSAGQL